MPIVPSDLATGWSVRYETLFRESYNQSVNVEREMLDRLMLQLDLGDYQGNQVTLDWLGAAPQMRAWVDEKRAIGLAKQSITVTMERKEASIEIDTDVLRDGRGNIYEPRIQEMAQNTSRVYYNLISALILAGESGLAYDGQYFFDTDHSEGDSGSQSNELTGAGTSQANIETDFYAAKAALMGFKDDKAVPLHPRDFRPLVWIPNDATLIQRFRTLQGATLISNTSNVLASSFDIVVDPSLTDANDWHMFRQDTVMKPFILIVREEPHYEDNFASGADDVFKRRIGMASAVGRMVAAYGMWQTAVKVKNS